MYRLFFLTYSTYLEHQNLLIFWLHLCPIDHKRCRWSWNLVLMILGDISTYNSHFWGKRLWPHPETKIIILHRDVKCVLLIIFLVQNLISSDNPVSIWLRWIWISPFWLGVKDRYCNTRFFLQEKFL